MIIDKLESWEYYRFGAAWELAFEFLLSLSPESDEKTYPLRSDDIFAQITRYETRSRKSAALESHRKYIDIQAILTGKEKIEATFIKGLVVSTPYDETKDIEFYDHSDGVTHISLYPETFVMFFPHDAHMPGLVLEENPEPVKKVVVKIKKELLANV